MPTGILLFYFPTPVPSYVQRAFFTLILLLIITLFLSTFLPLFSLLFSQLSSLCQLLLVTIIIHFWSNFLIFLKKKRLLMKSTHSLCIYLCVCLCPLLTYRATNCAVIQEVLSILWNQNVHYRVQNSPSLVPILNQIDLVHTIPSDPVSLRFILVMSTHT
jgi:hypothetical protein